MLRLGARVHQARLSRARLLESGAPFDGWAAENGSTDVTRLTLACGPGNRLIENGSWAVRFWRPETWEDTTV